MKKTFKKSLALGLLASLFIISCSSPDEVIVNDSTSKIVIYKKSTNQIDLSKFSENAELISKFKRLNSTLIHNDFPIHFDMKNEVVASECGATPFNYVISDEFGLLIEDFSNLGLPGWVFDEYTAINFLYTLYLDQDPQFFGNEGQYTNFMNKMIRSLEKFWDMPDEITVKGEHNSTLDDRDKMAAVYYNFAGLTMEEAYEQADFWLFINSISNSLVESPLLSLDGFATFSKQIVIGDGLVELASATGVEDKIVWSGILAHEWAHQIQFNNYAEWYPVPLEDSAEDTRKTELEADFFTGYYLTHKRGATYNWKRVEDFFELFFNIGDCSFTSSGHHGTPLQRMEAANQGYLLAKSAQKNGHILSADEVHEAFLASLSGIVN